MKVQREHEGTGNPKVARALRAARKRLKLTQAETAAQCGVTTGTYCSWESGRHGIRVGRIPTVSKVLALEVSQLV